VSKSASESSVRIALLFPELLGTYGDGGNAVVLAERLRWRGRDAEVVEVASSDPIPDSCDVYLLGGGEDAPQIEAARAIGTDGPVHRATDEGAVVFAVCAGAQIAGRRFHVSDHEQVDGLGLLDCETVRDGRPRVVGELLADAVELDLPPLTGFENHGSRTRLGPSARPLATVRAGVGNGDGTEGVVADRGRGKVVGTYLHGPALARNPALADLLLSWVTGPLEPVDDHEIDALRAERLRAVERGNLDGVARRSWRDHLLRRS
jgi:CobQ-like glutamine amidotransferase family enzyme